MISVVPVLQIAHISCGPACIITGTDSHRPEEEAGTLHMAAVAAAAVAAEVRRIRRSAAAAEARGTAAPQELAAGNGAGRCAEAAEAGERNTMTGETAEEAGSTIPRPIAPVEKEAEQGTVAGIPNPAAVLAGCSETEAQSRQAGTDIPAMPLLADWVVVGSTLTPSTAVAAGRRTAMRC